MWYNIPVKLRHLQEMISVKYEMTKNLENLLDQTAKLNKTYKDFKKIDVNPALKKAATIMLLESIDLICQELTIQQVKMED